MLKTKYKRGLVKMADYYGTTSKEKLEDVDVQISMKNLFPGTQLHSSTDESLHSYGRTLVIDLNKSEEDIFSEIRKNARYKINRAAKRDNVQFCAIFSPTNQQIDEFVEFFNQFAKNKNIPKCIKGKLQGLRDKDALTITYVKDEDEKTLCYHAYLRTKEYCSMIHSASARFDNSQIRSLIGRANRYLHWEDIKMFKEKGHKWYDFCGLFVDPSTDDELNLNRFKKEFGGIEIDVDKKIYAHSLIGKAVVFLFKWKMRNRPEYNRAKLIKHHNYSLGK
ncbi:hypothetical protein E3U55_11610 [Filobacillus milosensis]|uniref:Uncharacterized protein n=1 Tax=Filobacillus milosensis TaxID=94137 RepID=A0A4Y8IHT5_9BACI|nr:hypothetical protein [Filobacillus milosensis]TFB18911.1 hypothetical protein E3U55_11610 [Filobacillus milosensis]